MIGIFKQNKGAVSIFLVLILIPVITVTSLFVDASRVQLSKGVISSAGDLTLNTVLTQYDRELNDFYGLMGSCQDIDDFLEVAGEYFEACITSQGIDTADAKRYANQIKNLFMGESDISDYLQISLGEEESFSVNKVENGSLENPALIKRQLVEFMKYRSPINAAVELFTNLSSSAESLDGAADDVDLVEKKQKFYEAESKLMEKCLEIYLLVEDYKELEITKDWVLGLQQRIENYETDYWNIHLKIAEDLLGTGSYDIYKKAEIQTDQSYKNYESSQAGESTIKSLLNSAATAIDDFNIARIDLEQFLADIEVYDSNIHHDIRYWVNTVDKLNANNLIQKYATAATKMFDAKAQLEDAYSNPQITQEQDENKNIITKNVLDERHTLNNLYLDEGGDHSLRTHCKNILTQIGNYKTSYINSSTFKYNKIVDSLVDISTKAINNKTTDPSYETEPKIIKISTDLNDDYERVTDGNKILNDIVQCLEDLKPLVNDYETTKEIWSNAADSYSTDMAEVDRKEIEEMDKEISQYVNLAGLEEFTNRINNVKSLFGEILSGIDGFKYNGKKVKDLKTYKSVENICNMVKAYISSNKSQINDYAKDNFELSDNNILKKIGITDNNNPAFHSVNQPKMYMWMKGKFKDYEEEKSKTGKNKYDNEKGQGDKDLEEIESEGLFNQNNISEISGLPSENKDTYLGNTEITSALSKISDFISSLFGDLSGTLMNAAVNVRDDLYITDYITSMFSYDTFENEGKYNLLSESEQKNVNPINYKSKYSSVEDKWKSEDVKNTYNKTLTNKMVNTDNNWAYGSEVEYILYGNSNVQNKASSYGTIFMIRFVLNLPADFSRFWFGDTDEARLIKACAAAVSAATCGVVPESLIRLAICLGLTAAETAADLAYLRAGKPVILIKGKDDLFISFNTGQEGGISTSFNRSDPKNPANSTNKIEFSYSDYLKLFLFIRLIDTNSEGAYGVYARIADVIQVNMDKQIVKAENYQLKKAQVYYELESSVKVTPLMLRLPIVVNTEGDITSGSEWYKLEYSAIRGY